MKKIFSILMVALAMTAMVACEDDPTNPATPGGDTPGGENPGGGTTVQTDTTLMNYTLMRSLVDIDWDEACDRVLAMGFTEIDPEEFDEEEPENVRAFIKGSIMGNYYACYLRCDFPEVDNLVGAVVMHEHHMNSSTQAVCVENDVFFINDERQVLADMARYDAGCGGLISWNDMTSSGQYDGDEIPYPGADALESFVTDLRAMSEHMIVNANWADSYTYNGFFYVASCSAVCTTQPYASVMENIITLEKADNLD